MLVTLPNKNPFFSSPMPKNPKYIRERLFEGIDKDYNVTDMGIVVEVLGELENFHMSREELEDTRLGKHINELRRKASDNKELATRAKSLIKKWRDLLSPESGPPPGGGNNNNNSNLVTNGNSRLGNSHSYSGNRGAPPPARGSSRQSPRAPPVNSKLSPSANSSHRPTTAPSSASSQSARSNVRNNGPSNALSPPVSKTLPGSGSRDSPVVISSGSSSPASVQSVQEISRPCSPATSSVSIIQSRETSPVHVGQKRQRVKDDTELPPVSKCPRLNGASATSSPTSLKSAAVSSPRKNSKNARRARPQVASLGPDLKRQMLQARTGKVKTTQELIVNLGLESKVQTSPTGCSVSDLVPKEDKSELMDRFFSSQHKSESEEGSEPDLVSRPSTAAEEASSSEESSEPSRVPTPAPRESVEDILSQLPPIDSEKVLAELEQNMSEEEPEIEGLIPAFKPRTEVTSALVDDLNNGQLDHIGGIRDYQGDFKEWHQMASLPSKDGELLHILPYSLID